MIQPSLFSQEPDVVSVCELVRSVRDVLQVHFDRVGVEGEISNFRRPASGHCYFTLKDAEAQIRCVMWRQVADTLPFRPVDGMLVRIHGSVTVYEARGDLQIVVRSLQAAGEGALQQAFEALKRRLAAEGLFDARHKKRLPPYPERVGIITSGTGAALQDMLSVLARRFPLVDVVVCPVQVQGLGAAASVAGAIAAFNALPSGHPHRPDLLIVGRGGGSAEDLWAFNEEELARAIFASEIPIISAVGHETDVTIADFVADVRAATPSMAAELAVPDRREVALTVRGLYNALHLRLQRLLDVRRRHLRALTESRGFHRPLDRLQRYSQRLDELCARLEQAPPRLLERRKHHVEALQARLLLLDPNRPLHLGYARVERDGEIVTRARSLHPDDRVTLHFEDGQRRARIE
ncbi:MAG: exodeoxyribonuclease 7 large subunit [Rhodothermaceae bacterium]|nr:MAG: exodeoxyribonuclease 7 large subunit [Rhodothermaceae bacterium]